jgi:hypothetical protein
MVLALLGIFILTYPYDFTAGAGPDAFEWLMAGGVNPADSKSGWVNPVGNCASEGGKDVRFEETAFWRCDRLAINRHPIIGDIHDIRCRRKRRNECRQSDDRS